MATTVTGGVAFKEFPHAAGRRQNFWAPTIVPAAQSLALFTLRRKNLEPVFSLHRERLVSHLLCPEPIEVLSRPVARRSVTVPRRRSLSRCQTPPMRSVLQRCCSPAQRKLETRR